jgi:myb proto-oncogene protein
MGIDPLTHKPLSAIETPPPPPPPQQEVQVQNSIQELEQQAGRQSSSTNDISELGQNNEPETSLQSARTQDEENNIGSTYDTMERMNGFCTDEVPLIEPHEMLVPGGPSPSSTSSSSSYGSNNILDELLLPDFEWPLNNVDIGLWDDDLSSWDLLISDVDSGRKQATMFDPFLNQCPRTVLDQDYWTYGLM